MVEREWLLSHHSTIDTFPFASTEDDHGRNSWLERMQHSPQKVLIDGHRIVCMTKPNQITLSHGSFSHKLTFPIPEYVISFKHPVSCIKMGFSITLGINFVASGHLNGDICLWNAETSKLITKLISHRSGVTEILISPESTRKAQTQILSASQDRTAKVWDFEVPGFNMSQTANFSHPILCSAWSPNGRIVAFAGSSQKIGVFNKIIGGAILMPAVQQLSGHLHNIVCLKFMPDNAILVSASSDGRLLLWDPLEGSVKQMISMHFPLPNYVFPSEVTGIDISQFGHAIVSLSDKGQICVWNTLSMQLTTNQPDCVLNVSPEAELVINNSEGGSNRTIGLIMSEKYVLAPDFSNSKAQLFSLGLPAPPLKHLCRLTIRKVVPKSFDLIHLHLPPRLHSYLSYNTFC